MTKEEEIEDLKLQIKLDEKHLKKQLEGFDGKDPNKNDLIKSYKLNIIISREEIVNLQHDIMNEKLEKMKSSLKSQGILYENSLGINLTDINAMQKVVDLSSSIKHLQNNIQKNQVVFEYTGIDRYSELIEEGNIQLKQAEQELNKKAEYFLKSFTLHQVQSGLMQENERKLIREQHNFSSNDIENMFSQFSNSFDNISHTQSSKMTKELVQQALPKSDIENITNIDDLITKNQLCQIYGIQDIDDVQIFAIQHYDHNTIGEVSGMIQSAYEKCIGDGYNEELGESISLYVFNKKIGKLQQMIMPNDKNPTIISKDKEIELKKDIGTMKCKELASISYNGLNLMYYIGDDGSLKIAKEDGDFAKEILTQSLEHLEELDRMQERFSNIESEKVQETIPDTSKAQNPEQFRESLNDAWDLYLDDLRKRTREEELRNEMKRLRMPLEEREKLEAQENSFREKREGRIR